LIFSIYFQILSRKTHTFGRNKPGLTVALPLPGDVIAPGKLRLYPLQPLEISFKPVNSNTSLTNETFTKHLLILDVFCWGPNGRFSVLRWSRVNTRFYRDTQTTQRQQKQQGTTANNVLLLVRRKTVFVLNMSTFQI